MDRSSRGNAAWVGPASSIATWKAFPHWSISTLDTWNSGRSGATRAGALICTALPGEAPARGARYAAHATVYVGPIRPNCSTFEPVAWRLPAANEPPQGRSPRSSRTPTEGGQRKTQILVSRYLGAPTAKRYNSQALYKRSRSGERRVLNWTRPGETRKKRVASLLRFSAESQVP